MAYDVFISYRRDGGDTMARLLYDRLTAEGFSPFLDIEQMRSGRFNHQLYERIAECRHFLLILSPGALDRCRNEDDWVRLEILEALRLKKNIVPFMLRGFEFPRADPPLARLLPFHKPMPAQLLEIATFQGVAASQEYFDSTLDKLVKLLRDQPAQAAAQPAAPVPPAPQPAAPVQQAVPAEPRQRRELPRQISLFELLGIHEISEFDIGQRWAQAQSGGSLSVPIGVDEWGETVHLDLYRQQDGPHGLIGGPAGSGKSEFVNTLMFSLALHYPPDAVRMLLIDHQWAHTTRDLHRLPHLLPFVGELNRDSTASYLQAIWEQLKGHMDETAALLRQHDVRTLEQYNDLAAKDPALPRRAQLVVFIDSYRTLKMEWPECAHLLLEIGQSAEAARCGLHLIFATQKPEGVVDNVLDAISSFKICTSGLSQWREGEIIPEAPAQRPGRLYLQTPASWAIRKLQLAYSGQGAPDVTEEAQGYRWFFGNRTQREMILSAVVRQALG